MKIVITSANSATGSMLIPVLKAVVHLSGDLNAKRAAFYEEANLETARVVAAHARAGRLIYLSYPHASSGEKNHYLRTKGQAEEVLYQTGIPLVVFRCAVILDAPDKASKIDVLFKARRGGAVPLVGWDWPVPVIGSGRQTMRPVYRGTVVAAIASAVEGDNWGKCF